MAAIIRLSWCQWSNAAENEKVIHMDSQRTIPNVTDAMHKVLFIFDDVIKWKHFPRYWPFVQGIHRSPVNSTHKGQWRGALVVSLIFAWINCWTNHREAGDSRRHRAHYDAIVMSWDTMFGDQGYLNMNDTHWPSYPVCFANTVHHLWIINNDCTLMGRSIFAMYRYTTIAGEARPIKGHSKWKTPSDAQFGRLSPVVIQRRDAIHPLRINVMAPPWRWWRHDVYSWWKIMYVI